MATHELKKEFFKELRESTVTYYTRIFSMVESYEEEYKKDLKDFDFKQIENVLYGFEAKNRNTVESYGRILSSYLNWCKENRYINENVMKSLKPKDFQKYVKNNERYIEIKDLIRYEDGCENFQDAVILRLLYIGVGGKGLSEIRNLKKSDINGNKLTLINTLTEDKNGFPIKYTTREIEVDDRTLYLLNGAINQKIYMKKNGQIEEGTNIRPFTDLANNDYVVRASITKNNSLHTPVDKFVIYRRIEMVGDYFGIELTTKFLQRSGMMYIAKGILEESGDLDLNDIKLISNIFNISSYHNLKGFLNKENVEKELEDNNG